MTSESYLVEIQGAVVRYRFLPNLKRFGWLCTCRRFRFSQYCTHLKQAAEAIKEANGNGWTL